MCCDCRTTRGISHSRRLLTHQLAISWWGSAESKRVSQILSRGVRAPLLQPGIVDGLDSWYLRPGYLNFGRGGFDQRIYDEAFAHVLADVFDDRYDRLGGMHGPPVRHASTLHPRPYRIEYGVCHGQKHGSTVSALISYPATGIPPSLWSKRHLPPVIFALVAHVCIILREHVPQLQQEDPFPNSVTCHWYPSERTTRNLRGNTQVGYHTDSCSIHRKRVAQRDGTPVISISFGESMLFKVKDGNEEWGLTHLEHGSVLIWTSHDDKSGVKHSVTYPPPSDSLEGQESGGRWVLIARWIDTIRDYNHEFPHRNVSEGDCVWLPL